MCITFSIVAISFLDTLAPPQMQLLRDFCIFLMINKISMGMNQTKGLLPFKAFISCISNKVFAFGCFLSEAQSKNRCILELE